MAGSAPQMLMLAIDACQTVAMTRRMRVCADESHTASAVTLPDTARVMNGSVARPCPAAMSAILQPEAAELSPDSRGSASLARVLVAVLDQD